MKLLIRFFGGLLVSACALARGAETNNAPVRLRIGMLQMALGRPIAEKLDSDAANSAGMKSKP